MPAAGHDKPYAMRLYLWNVTICERLYLPLQTAEICVRNTIHETLTRRYGDWCTNHAFTNLLLGKDQAELQKTTADQKVKRGATYTIDHVVAAMTFGFWANLLAKSFEHHIWQQGIKRSFPHAPNDLDREDAYKKINQLRVFRNKVAHHYAIFDSPWLDEHKNALQIIGWVSPDTAWLVRELVNPREAAQKPMR